MAKSKILIIDDEESFCRIIKITLESGGDFEVIIATNGASGIVEAQKKPDLILLDIRMVDMDGIEVLKRLKKDESTTNIPVIILSAIGYKPLQVRAAELRAEEYLTKPVDVLVLKDKIEKALKKP
jgi:two-component system alkaline phosphatase synthesis response regulator PhoP